MSLQPKVQMKANQASEDKKEEVEELLCNIREGLVTLVQNLSNFKDIYGKGLDDIISNERIFETLICTGETLGKVSPFLASLEKNIKSFEQKASLPKGAIYEEMYLSLAKRGNIRIGVPIFPTYTLYNLLMAISTLEKMNEVLGDIVKPEKDRGVKRPIADLYLVFVFVLCIQTLLYYITQKHPKVWKVCNTTLYSLTVGGSILYLVWVVIKSYRSEGRMKEILRQRLSGVISMIPMVVGIHHTEMIECGTYTLTMMGISAIMVYAQDLVENKMTWRQICVVGVRNAILAIAYCCEILRMFMRNEYRLRCCVCGGVVIFVLLVGILCYSSSMKEGSKTRLPGNVMFVLTVVIGTFVSWRSRNEYYHLRSRDGYIEGMEEARYDSIKGRVSCDY
ncbi:hypothetical protein EROM_091530 [Encephalitozoon romaleae SJ-2008]|uniref:Uncharacterized protein n=1 Tax=Encephalitozoon romaleae (strain SJ-2008) TaxID=1178016 RepID=I7APJ2_ENCRO|nr:hypothetical protein EROM_091530 [Encephalitozoon romaleae SJ-2008]AFN83769.1 hypothetical protein EROM_091530 [Encephalitozoon romaleae SJ-2008]